MTGIVPLEPGAIDSKHLYKKLAEAKSAGLLAKFLVPAGLEKILVSPFADAAIAARPRSRAVADCVLLTSDGYLAAAAKKEQKAGKPRAAAKGRKSANPGKPVAASKSSFIMETGAMLFVQGTSLNRVLFRRRLCLRPFLHEVARQFLQRRSGGCLAC